jgi:hypothetical protein
MGWILECTGEVPPPADGCDAGRFLTLRSLEAGVTTRNQRGLPVLSLENWDRGLSCHGLVGVLEDPHVVFLEEPCSESDW